MTLDTPVPAARAVVEDERDAVTAKLRAYDAFTDRVRDVPTGGTGGEAPGPVGSTLAATTRRGGVPRSVRRSTRRSERPRASTTARRSSRRWRPN
ncbi:hypothetical protein ACFQL0_15190 [Haloplanus litoreus]|uniref:DUF7260 family protein n=1 Tax=Haloplanus litoreus TaxID=767515 RepID=UPI00361E58CB